MAFRFQDVVKEFPDKHPVYLARTLADMVDRGMLYKIARNLYHIIPLNAGPESYEPDSLRVKKWGSLNYLDKRCLTKQCRIQTMS